MRAYAFEARFHANVQALHRSTLEVTCEERLTPRGDCVALTSSTHDPSALAEACPDGWEGALVVLTRFGGFWVRGTCAPEGVGCSFVIRKSSSRAPRTLIIGADKSASDIPREVVKKGRLWGARALLILLSRPRSRGPAVWPWPRRG
ncbi:MAG: DUF371 domain-containing protein [Crenarchaeota archaeon]|nr:DUF371 domain-containing protein [Thermoproteota archaeon]